MSDKQMQLVQLDVHLLDQAKPVELAVWKSVDLPCNHREAESAKRKIAADLTEALRTMATVDAVGVEKVTVSHPVIGIPGSVRQCTPGVDLETFIRKVVHSYCELLRFSGERDFLKQVQSALECDNELTQPSHWVCRLSSGVTPMLYVGMPQVVIYVLIDRAAASHAKVSVRSKSSSFVHTEEFRLGIIQSGEVLRSPADAPQRLAEAVRDLIDVYGVG
jgi:hypothetical protein